LQRSRHTIGMPTIFANLAASRSWHISSQKIAQLKFNFLWGEVVEKRIMVDYRWGKELIALIKNVLTGVCQICGEQYLKAEIVKEMDRLAHSTENPKKLIQITLRELVVA
jgi:YgiT-type zinc finger domain-containing protein